MCDHPVRTLYQRSEMVGPEGSRARIGLRVTLNRVSGVWDLRSPDLDVITFDYLRKYNDVVESTEYVVLEPGVELESWEAIDLARSMFLDRMNKVRSQQAAAPILPEPDPAPWEL